MSRRTLVLVGAGLAFMAGQGFARFGLTLILPQMRAGLGMSAADIGVLAGLAFGAYLLAAAPAGAEAARRGPRLVVSGSLALCGVGMVLTGLAPSYGLALAAQALTGAAGAGVIVPVLGLAPGWFEQRYWARATGAIVAGGGVGLALSGLLVPRVIAAGGAEGWRQAWICLGLMMFGTALLAAMLLRRSPRAVERQRGGLDLRPVYRSRVVWRLSLAFACFAVAYAVYGTFFGTQLVNGRGLPTDQAGWLWALGGIVSIPSGLLGGWLADRFGRRGPLVLLFLAQGLGVAALAVGASWLLYVGSVALYGLTVWGFPAVITAASADVVGPELAPAAAGLLVLCFGVGQALGPVVAGGLAQLSGSFDTALLVGALADGCGILAALALPAPGRTQAARDTRQEGAIG
jgi:predicted MFS family arabinose efflux permease